MIRAAAKIEDHPEWMPTGAAKMKLRLLFVEKITTRTFALAEPQIKTAGMPF
jgi:hypothetical protein